MAARNNCTSFGTSALASREESHLRLVYDSRFDARPAGKIKHREEPRRSNALLVVALATMLLAGSLYLIVANIRDHSVGSALDQVGTQTIRACANDSLWSIATRCEVDGVSTYDVVQWIKAHNELQTSALRPGEQLIVPLANAK